MARHSEIESHTTIPLVAAAARARLSYSVLLRLVLQAKVEGWQEAGKWMVNRDSLDNWARLHGNRDRYKKSVERIVDHASETSHDALYTRGVSMPRTSQSLRRKSIPHDSDLSRANLRRRYRSEIGDWLSGFNWSWFVTLTAETNLSFYQLVRAFHSYIAALETIAGRQLPWFMVVERHAGRGHVHAFIGAADAMSTREIRRKWRAGRVTDAKRYDRKRGASHYLAKQVGIEGEDFEISKEAPIPLRGADGGCSMDQESVAHLEP